MILALLLACASPQAGPRVFALSWGRSERFLHRSLLADAPEGERVPASWMAWLILDGDQAVLVDTGATDPGLLARWGIGERRPVPALLARVGLRPEDIDDLVLTHPHWDHLGDTGRYTGARVWLQREALAWAERKVADGREHAGVRPRDLAALRTAGERLSLLDGDHALSESVTLRAGGGHTPGAQWVEVRRPSGSVALASDIACVYENLERDVAPGGSLDGAADRRAMEEMRRLVGLAGVIPGHDPRVEERLRWFADGVGEAW